MRCGPCTRQRFCEQCAKERAARSTKRSGERYQQTEAGRARHRARSLAYYLQGQERRRQRRAQEAALHGSGLSEVMLPPDELPADAAAGERAAPGARCLTQKRVGEAEFRRVMVGAAQMVSAAQEPVSRGVEEAVDAKTARCGETQEAGLEEPDVAAAGCVPSGDVEASRTASGPVLTTVAQVRAALFSAREVGREDVVVRARCSRCDRVGRVVHFDGVLRARAREPG